jgi:hypothetical protein
VNIYCMLTVLILIPDCESSTSVAAYIDMDKCSTPDVNFVFACLVKNII